MKMPTNSSGPSDLNDLKGMEEDRLRQRLLSLEREADWLRSRVRLLSIGLLVTLVLGAIGAFSQGIPGIGKRDLALGTLTTERVSLVDAQGVVRGEWRVDEEGNSRMALMDRRERSRLSMSVLSGGSPGLSLINANGKSRAALGLAEDESTNLVLADGGGLPRVVLGLSTGDAAQLVFIDANQMPQIALGLDEMGLANVILPEDSPPEGSGAEGG